MGTLLLWLFDYLLNDVRSESSGGQVVAMRQPAGPWHGYDPAVCVGIRLRPTTCRSPLLQCKVCSVVAVIADVFAHQSSQGPFIQHNDVVEQIAAVISEPIPGMGRIRCDQCSCG